MSSIGSTMRGCILLLVSFRRGCWASIILIIAFIVIIISYSLENGYIVIGSFFTVFIMFIFYRVYKLTFKLYRRKAKNTKIQEFRYHLNKLGNVDNNELIQEQRKVYNTIWENLQEILFKIEVLWKFPSVLDLWDYNARVNELQIFVRNNALFIRDIDYEKLLRIMQPLEKYDNGKGEVILSTLKGVDYQDILSVINSNEGIKKEFEILLEELRISFTDQLMYSFGLSENSNLENLKQQHTRRLMILQQQQAYKGYDTPPHIIMEMEDIEQALKKIEEKHSSL